MNLGAQRRESWVAATGTLGCFVPSVEVDQRPAFFEVDIGI